MKRWSLVICLWLSAGVALGQSERELYEELSQASQPTIKDITPKPKTPEPALPHAMTVVQNCKGCGNIQGVVYSPEGAELPNVKLTLTSPALTEPIVLSSAEDGVFLFRSLSPGKYQLKAEDPNLQVTQQEVVVSSGRTSSIYLTDEIFSAGTNEEVLVIVCKIREPIVNTRKTTQGFSIGASAIRRLPGK